MEFHSFIFLIPLQGSSWCFLALCYRRLEYMLIEEDIAIFHDTMCKLVSGTVALVCGQLHLHS